MGSNIRNFSIIAHIDHGKSTIADCLLGFCGSVSKRESRAQIMDTMDIEKERGITIKAQSARLIYKRYETRNLDSKNSNLENLDSKEVTESKSLDSNNSNLQNIDSNNSQNIESSKKDSKSFKNTNNLENLDSKDSNFLQNLNSTDSKNLQNLKYNIESTKTDSKDSKEITKSRSLDSKNSNLQNIDCHDFASTKSRNDTPLDSKDTESNSQKVQKEYILNLIDTPGHVDFSYEVSRSLKSCEGALLVVDASQGIQAQTIANVYIALENNLEIIPVINKIDLPAANPQKVMQEIEDVLGIDCSDALLVSAKTGQGIQELLNAIVDRIPPPKTDDDDFIESKNAKDSKNFTESNNFKSDADFIESKRDKNLLDSKDSTNPKNTQDSTNFIESKHTANNADSKNERNSKDFIESKSKIDSKDSQNTQHFIESRITKDSKNFTESKDNKNLVDSMESKGDKNHKTDSKDFTESNNSKSDADFIESKRDKNLLDSKVSQNTKDSLESKHTKDSKNFIESKQAKSNADSIDSKNSADSNNEKNSKDFIESKGTADSKDSQNTQHFIESRITKDSKGFIESKGDKNLADSKSDKNHKTDSKDFTESNNSKSNADFIESKRDKNLLDSKVSQNTKDSLESKHTKDSTNFTESKNDTTTADSKSDKNHKTDSKDSKPTEKISQKPLKALVYDSWFDNYLGALGLIRIMEGEVRKGDIVKTMSADKSYQVLGLEYPHPLHRQSTQILKSGEIGILNLGLKSVTDIAVGDTITHLERPTDAAVPGFVPAKPFVFAGIYPLDTDRFEDLRDALNKLKLNDSALHFEPESSVALGFGFRVGFLGLLHMEVVKERLEREFSLDLIASAPSVRYEVGLSDGSVISVQNPSELPQEQKIAYIKEPYVRATIITPSEFVGNVITLLNHKRGVQENMEYLNESRVMLTFALPSNEIIMDFYDRLKSGTKGYASFDYEPIEYRQGDLVKLDVRVAGDVVDALSVIIDRSKSYERGRALVAQMKEIIPRQLFEVAIQASIGNKVIARENVKSMGKNVTAKCYGGDITRKRKLLEKQKEGKKRLKAIGKVEIPQEAFLAVLKID